MLCIVCMTFTCRLCDVTNNENDCCVSVVDLKHNSVNDDVSRVVSRRLASS